MNRIIAAVIATTALSFGASAAFAEPKCDVPKEKWMKEADFKAKAEAEGYKIKKFKVNSGNCYEIYGTKDGRLHLFCKLRIVFGEPIPAADLQIRDQSHKMAELRRMKNRLRDELEQLLADNAFAVRLAETAAEEPAAPDDKPQLPE